MSLLKFLILENSIEHGGNRTHDHQDRNLVLYPLSYMPDLSLIIYFLISRRFDFLKKEEKSLLKENTYLIDSHVYS